MSRELLKKMLYSIINDDVDTASVEMHEYLSSKMRSIAIDKPIAEAHFSTVLKNNKDLDALKDLAKMFEVQIDVDNPSAKKDIWVSLTGPKKKLVKITQHAVGQQLGLDVDEIE